MEFAVVSTQLKKLNKNLQAISRKKKKETVKFSSIKMEFDLSCSRVWLERTMLSSKLINNKMLLSISSIYLASLKKIQS